jgi:hypothetical protein
MHTPINSSQILCYGIVLDTELSTISTSQSSIPSHRIHHQKISDLQSRQHKDPDSILDRQFYLLQEFHHSQKEIQHFLHLHKPLDNPTPKGDDLEDFIKRYPKQKLLTPEELAIIKEDLSHLCPITSLKDLASHLDTNPHHIIQKWNYPILTSLNIDTIHAFINNALSHAQTFRQTPPWDSIAYSGEQTDYTQSHHQQTTQVGFTSLSHHAIQ